MSKQLIVTSGLKEVKFSISVETQAQKNQVLAATRKVAVVDSAASQELATEAIKSVNKLLKLVEASRKDVKSPILDLGKTIDNLAKDFIEELESEKSRINTSITNYQTELHRKAEAKRKLIEGLAKKRQERLDAELKKAEAAAQEASSPEEAQEAEVRAGELKFEAETLASKPVAALVPAVPKAAGMSVGTDWDYEVTDLDALVKARPDLCKIEASPSAIKTALRGGMRTCPGLNIYEKIKVGIR